MALSTEDRKIRTRREAAPEGYLAYLNSSAWRQTRNRKLREGNWTCERCLSRRDLNVHHKTYVRLGMELMADLEVLCFTCHREHHVAEAQATPTDPLGIYLKLASEVLNRRAYSTVADLSDAVKTLCAQRHIEVNPQRIAKAISLTAGTRLADGDKPYRSVVEPRHHDEPISHAQAVELLTRLGMPRDVQKAIAKPMPRVTMRSQQDIDRERALEMVAAEIKASLERCEALERETA